MDSGPFELVQTDRGLLRELCRDRVVRARMSVAIAIAFAARFLIGQRNEENVWIPSSGDALKLLLVVAFFLIGACYHSTSIRWGRSALQTSFARFPLVQALLLAGSYYLVVWIGCTYVFDLVRFVRPTSWGTVAGGTVGATLGLILGFLVHQFLPVVQMRL